MATKDNIGIMSCTVATLRDICRQHRIRGFSALDRQGLVDAIKESGVNVTGYRSSSDMIEEAAAINRKNGRKGDVRVDKLPGRFSKDPRPRIDYYMAVNVCSSSTGWSKGLSPMILGPVEHNEKDYNGSLLPTATCIENLHQGVKGYDIDLDDKGNLLPSYYERKHRIFTSKKGIRHPVPNINKEGNKSMCLFSFVNGERLTYMEARKKVYCPLYAKMVVKSEAFARLSHMMNKGYNILLLDYDGYPVDSTTLEAAFNDISRPFGHGHVLYCILTNDRVWER